MADKLNLTDAEWLEKLGPERFRILRQAGTERPFTGKFDGHKAEGTYTCGGCGAPLFASDEKFDSGCGWPSFDEALEGTIEKRVDRIHGMVRTEIRCKACGSHLGHLFDDGPTSSGLRYCVNSVSLTFTPR